MIPLQDFDSYNLIWIQLILSHFLLLQYLGSVIFRKQLSMSKCKRTNQNVLINDFALYQVEQIVGERINKSGFKEFKIRWRGYGEKDDTWQPKSNLQIATHLTNQLEVQWKNTNLKSKIMEGQGQSKKQSKKQTSKQKLNINIKLQSETNMEQEQKQTKDTKKQKNNLDSGKSKKPKKIQRRHSQKLESTYRVDKIVGKKYDEQAKRLFYRVRWTNYSPDEDTWQPYQNLTNVKSLIQAFEKKTKKIEKEKKNIKKEYEVLRIVGKRQTKQYGIQYKVRWRGYKASEDTWQPKKNLVKVKILINNYQNQIEKKELQMEKLGNKMQTPIHQVSSVDQMIKQTDNYEIGGDNSQKSENQYEYIQQSCSIDDNQLKGIGIIEEILGPKQITLNEEIGDSYKSNQMEEENYHLIEECEILGLDCQDDSERFQTYY